MQRPVRGFTLIELLLCLGICVFLLLQVAQPHFAKRHKQLQVDAMMRELQDNISMARLAAITESTMVTFCRSMDGLHCGGSWLDGTILFTDHNEDRVINGADRLLFRSVPFALEGRLRFNSFGNKQYLQLTPRGITNFQNGNFTWCPANGDTHLIRQLILSYSGRTRMARDSNGDGIVENSQGQNVTCP